MNLAETWPGSGHRFYLYITPKSSTSTYFCSNARQTVYCPGIYKRTCDYPYVLLELQSKLNRHLQHMLYLLQPHFSQSSLKLVQEQRKKSLHTHIASIPKSHLLPSHICKIHWPHIEPQLSTGKWLSGTGHQGKHFNKFFINDKASRTKGTPRLMHVEDREDAIAKGRRSEINKKRKEAVGKEGLESQRRISRQQADRCKETGEQWGSTERSKVT